MDENYKQGSVCIKSFARIESVRMFSFGLSYFISFAKTKQNQSKPTNSKEQLHLRISCLNSATVILNLVTRTRLT